MRKTVFKDWAGYRRSIAEIPQGILTTVKRIIKDIRRHGDKALIKATRRYERVTDTAFETRLPDGLWDELCRTALRDYSPVWDDFRAAMDNIRFYHEKQRDSGFNMESGGAVMGQAVLPVDSAGVYVPGGRAFYPSSVLMNVIPARIAGVKEIYLATPPDRSGAIHPLLALLARELGVNAVFRMGGAQAIAAFAYGTATVPAVAKITGPGNAYVAAAKMLVQGTVGIDSVAGPSEVLIMADDTANPKWLAADLCAQAEHDPNTTVILVSLSGTLSAAVMKELDTLSRQLPRNGIIRQSLDKNGVLIQVNNQDEAFDILNRMAPEHAEFHLDLDLKAVLPRVRNAGALFVGPYTPVAMGDYFSGTNHVLPTNGTALFSSPLGVQDFVKRVSYLALDSGYMARYADTAARLADFEGFSAHALSIRLRKGP